MKKSAEYLLIFIAIQFVSVTLANGVILLKGGQPGADAASAAVGMTVASFLLTALVFVAWLKTVPVSSDYLRSKPFAQLAVCVVLGLAVIPVSLFVQGMMPSLTDNNEELFKSVIASPMGFVSLVVLGPITEEIVFRGSILKALSSSSGSWKAILLSALAFAIIHFNPAQLVHAFAMGVMLGWICIKTKSIVPCVLIHIINNGTAFLSVKYMPEVTLTSAPLVIISSVFIIISLWGIVKFSARQ